MDRRLWMVLVLVLSLALMGMGKLDQGEKPGEIPIPDREVSAVVVDSEGVSLNLSQFSVNGQTMLSGKMGAGKATVAFAQIRTISLTPDPKAVRVHLELNDHSSLNLILDRGLAVTGRAKFGTYQVNLEQVKKIEILSVTEKKK